MSSFYIIFLASILVTFLSHPPPLDAVSLPIKPHLTTSGHHYRTTTPPTKAASNGDTIFITPTDSLVPLYYTQVQIGNPPFQAQLALDGSTPITWVQTTDCTTCFDSYQNFNPNASATFHLISEADPTCRPPHAGGSSGHGTCAYDLWFTQGLLAADRFSFPASSSPLAVDDLVFGAGTSNHEEFGGNESQIVGVFGLGGAHRASFFRQMNLSWFSYCLSAANATSSPGSTLDFGAEEGFLPNSTGSTAFIHPADHPFDYYVNVTAIRVNSTLIPVPSETRGGRRNPGFVIDMGKPITWLSKDVYGEVKEAVVRYFRSSYGFKPEEESRSGFDLCYGAADFSLHSRSLTLPEVELTFQGGGALLLREPQLFRAFPDFSEVCFMMQPTIGVGPSRLGAMLQTGHRFLFDLQESTVAFAPNSC